MDISLDEEYIASFDYRDDEDARNQEAELIEALAEGELYEDPDFPANGAALYLDPNRPAAGSVPVPAVSWRRISSGTIAGCTEPRTFPMDGSATVVQGALADGWFLNALAIVARNPALLRSVIVSDRFAEQGMYTLKFYKAGKYHYVHVDDRMPCRRSGHVLYARASDASEAWVMVLEKAYAKLHGCYENLQTGHLYYALNDLTGLPTLRYKRGDVGGRIADGALWAELKELLGAGAAMGCAQTAELGEAELRRRGVGVLTARAYQVLEAVDAHADSTADFDALDEKLVKVYDPWGMTNWTGPFSDVDPIWSRYPALRDQLHPTLGKEPLPAADDDAAAADEPKPKPKPKPKPTFWMRFSDLWEQFDQVCAVAAVGGNEKRYAGMWKPGDPKSSSGGPMAGHGTFQQNPQYAFALVDKAVVAVQLHVLDKRWKAGKMGGWVDGRTRKWVEARGGGPSDEAGVAHGFVLLKLNGNKPRCTVLKAEKVLGASQTVAPLRTVSGVFRLLPGRYAIVPFQGDVLESPEEFALVLTNDSVNGVQYEQEGDALPELLEADLSDDEGDVVPRLHPEPGAAPEVDYDDNHRHTLALYDEAAVLAYKVASMETQYENMRSLVERLETAANAAGVVGN